MLLLSATGIASYNTLSYIGLTSTTALNVCCCSRRHRSIIMVWAYLLFRETPTHPPGARASSCPSPGSRPSPRHGSLDVLEASAPERAAICGCSPRWSIYAFYCVMLRHAPGGASVELSGRRDGDRILMMLPLMLWELSAGARDPRRAAVRLGNGLHGGAAVLRRLSVFQPWGGTDRCRPGRAIDAPHAAVRQRAGGVVPARTNPHLSRRSASR